LLLNIIHINKKKRLNNQKESERLMCRFIPKN